MMQMVGSVNKSIPGESKPMTGQVNVKQLINRTPYHLWCHRPKAIQCRNNRENTM